MQLHALRGRAVALIFGRPNSKNSMLDLAASPIFYASQRATATAGDPPRGIERKISAIQAEQNGFLVDLGRLSWLRLRRYRRMSAILRVARFTCGV